MPDPATASDNLLELVNDPAAPIVVHLGKSPIPLVDTPLVLADLVECDFPGYAPVIGPEFFLTDEEDTELGNVITDDVLWIAGVIVTPQVAYCVYITRDAVGGTPQLLDAKSLDEPFVFETEGQTLRQVVRFESFPDA